MGAQRVKKEEPVEEKKAPPKERVVKKWKGKEWFSVIAPPMFGSQELGEIPTTDPKSLINRTIEVSLAELLNNPTKYYMKLSFRIISLNGKKAQTRFNGLKLVKEQIFRIVRKRASKVEIIHDVETKDGWLLHLKLFAILNRSCNLEIQRKVRKQATGLIEEFVSKATIDDVVKTAADGLIQKNIKKFGSSIYPIRFCEIVKIDVKKIGKVA